MESYIVFPVKNIYYLMWHNPFLYLFKQFHLFVLSLNKYLLSTPVPDMLLVQGYHNEPDRKSLFS